MVKSYSRIPGLIFSELGWSEGEPFNLDHLKIMNFYHNYVQINVDQNTLTIQTNLEQKTTEPVETV